MSTSYNSGGDPNLFTRNNKKLPQLIYEPGFQDAVTYAMEVAFQSTGFNTDFNRVKGNITVTALPAAGDTVLTLDTAANVTFTIPTQTANNTVTMPTAASFAGCRATFITNQLPNGTNTLTISVQTANNMHGYIIGASVLNVSSKTSVVFSANSTNNKIGDKVTFFSTGGKWIIEGYSSGTALGLSVV